MTIIAVYFAAVPLYQRQYIMQFCKIQDAILKKQGKLCLRLFQYKSTREL